MARSLTVGLLSRAARRSRSRTPARPPAASASTRIGWASDGRSRAPSATPTRVGTATDQPTTPRIAIELNRLLFAAARPQHAVLLRADLANHALGRRGKFRAFGLRHVFPPRAAAAPGRSPAWLQSARAFFSCSSRSRNCFSTSGFSCSRLVPRDRVARRDRHLRPAFHQDSVIDRQVLFRLSAGLERQDARHQRSHEIDVFRQNAEPSVLGASALMRTTSSSSSTSVGSQTVSFIVCAASSMAPIM